MEGSVENISISTESSLYRRLPATLQRLYWELLRDLGNFKLNDWRQLETHAPDTLHFNITDICNARCSFCISRLVKPDGIMSMQVFEKALADYVEMGGGNICFNPLTGEPLLDPLLFERLKVVSSYANIGKVYFFTNGLLLADDGMIEGLLKSCLKEINISVCGYNREQFRQFMGVDKFDQVMTGIIKLLSRTKEAGSNMEVQIHFRGGAESLESSDAVKRVLPSMNDEFVKKIHCDKLYDNWAGAISKNDIPRGADFYTIGLLRLRPCTRTYQPAILVNGDVRACDCRYGEMGKHDELVLGNVLNSSLSELWRGSRIREIRESFPRFCQPSVCRKCNVYSPV